MKISQHTCRSVRIVSERVNVNAIVQRVMVSVFTDEKSGLLKMFVFFSSSHQYFDVSRIHLDMNLY